MADRRQRVTELLELAQRARIHAENLSHHQAGKSLLEFAEELEDQARALLMEDDG